MERRAEFAHELWDLRPPLLSERVVRRGDCPGPVVCEARLCSVERQWNRVDEVVGVW